MPIPQEVLSDALGQAIGARTVKTAVFTSFSFDPGFFEAHVLPAIFPHHSFSSTEKVRLMQLEYRLRTFSSLVLYYDAQALASDSTSPKLAYKRIPIHWNNGVFHPKLVILLLEEEESDFRSLLVCCQSANLTRSGWWENIECASIAEIHDFRSSKGKQGSPIRNDLRAILNRIKRCSKLSSHVEIDEVIDFLNKRVHSSTGEETSGTFSRLFGGMKSKSFINWLLESIPNNLRDNELKMEVISPYFDKYGKQLERLVEKLKPIETRVFLPKHDDGTVLVNEAAFKRISALENVKWAEFPTDFTSRKGNDSDLASRFVHAKVVRLWSGESNLSHFAIVGSVNCTTAANGPNRNFEAAVLVDVSSHKNIKREWLLVCQNDQPEAVFQSDDSLPGEFDEFDRPSGIVSVLFDWQTNNLQVVPSPETAEKQGILPLNIKTGSGDPLFTVEEWMDGKWKADSGSKISIRSRLEKSSLLRMECELGSWMVLVEETGLAHRPSLYGSLTPTEILEFWSLLTPEQRESYLGVRIQNLTMEGLRINVAERTGAVKSVFSQYSGVFHAFGHFWKHILRCLEEGNQDYAEALLFGNKFDSLPMLLKGVLGKLNDVDKDPDPVLAYIKFLTAKQLCNDLPSYNRKCHEFFQVRNTQEQELNCLIECGIKQFKGEFTESMPDDEFLTWFEELFLEKAG